MSEMDLKFLKNRHPDQDIWVLAAGPSSGFVDPAFFGNKLTLGVNHVFDHFPVDYVIAKEGYAINRAVAAGCTVIGSRYHCGSHKHNQNCAQGNWYVFDHQENRLQSVDLAVIGSDDKLVVSFSTITSALHLAAYMGSQNIIVVGHDCGLIDGEAKLPGYYTSDFQVTQPGFYREFIGSIEPQTLAVRERLEQVYGCRIYSLNPWINLGMEGHKYERTSES